MEMTKRPYELLVRWCEKTGEMKGAHIKWVHAGIDEDGEQVVNVSKAKPVDVGKGEGYPLADVLPVAVQDALVAYEVEKRGRLSAEEARDAAEHSRSQAQLDKDSAESVKVAAEQVAAQEQSRREKAETDKEQERRMREATEAELVEARAERETLREELQKAREADATGT